MKVDLQAGEPHFLEHLVPIWKALPEEERGVIYTGNREVRKVADRLGVPTDPRGRPLIPSNSTAVRLVASWGDFKRIRHHEDPVVFAEHGVGYTFGTGTESYAGGRGKERVNLFLCPNEQVARANREIYPKIPSEIVGCPKNDAMTIRGVVGRVVCVSFHWPAHICPETNWAFPEYRNYLRHLSQQAGCEVIGHGHPRNWPQQRSLFERFGIEPVESFDEVLERCDVYVNDSSSTIYEAAAAGRGVVVLNSKYYRREINHGLRFWDHIPGPQVDRGEDLAPTIKLMLDGGWRNWDGVRQQAVEAAYGPWGNDGEAAKRAVAAIRTYFG